MTPQETKLVQEFLQENLNQEIEPDFIKDMTSTKALRKFFHFNLTDYISPDTNDFVKTFINLLKD